MSPIVSGGGSRPFIDDTEPGIVVNRAGGFVSAWETFDLEQPGVGWGKLTVTAADSDGLTWGFDPGNILLSPRVEVSQDGVLWVKGYGSGGGIIPGLVATIRGFDASDPAGSVAEYLAITPRMFRVRLGIEADDGTIYSGLDDPTATFTLDYTAG